MAGMKWFYTDRELAEMLGVSVSLVRKMAKQGPSSRGAGTLDIRLIEHFTVGNMRRWNAEAADRLLGVRARRIGESCAEDGAHAYAHT